MSKSTLERFNPFDHKNWEFNSSIQSRTDEFVLKIDRFTYKDNSICTEWNVPKVAHLSQYMRGPYEYKNPQM